MPSEPRKRAKPKTEEPHLSRGRTREGAIFPVAPSAASLPGTYAATLQEIKSHLRSARVRAILAANPIVIEAYWNTGKIILARQEETGWGSQDGQKDRYDGRPDVVAREDEEREWEE